MQFRVDIRLRGLDAFRLFERLQRQTRVHALLRLLTIHFAHLLKGLPSILEEVFQAHALIHHALLHIAQHGSDLVFHHRLGNFHFRHFGELFDHFVFKGALRAVFGGFFQALAYGSLVFLQRIAIGNVLGKLIVQRGQFLHADGIDLHLEGGGLALEVFSVVFLGEGHVDLHLVANVLAHQLILEARNEVAGTDHQRLPLGGAAFELLTFAEALIIDVHLVVQLYRPVGHIHIAGDAVALALDFGVHIVVRHFVHDFFRVDGFVIAQLHLGIFIHDGGEDQILALFDLFHIQFRAGNGLEAGFLQRFFVSIGKRDFKRVFIQHARTIIAFHQRARRVSLAETRYVIALHRFAERLFHALFKGIRIHGDRDLALNLAQFFYGCTHLKIPSCSPVQFQQ